MDMTLTVHLPRRRPQPVDVVVEWSRASTASELCAALADHLGEPVPGLSTGGRPVPADCPVGVPPLLHGASVAVASSVAVSSGVPTVGSAVLDLVVVGGPDAGRSVPLAPPGVVVGRAAAGGLSVADGSLSRRHLFVGVGPAGVTVEDLGSTNGVWVDGERVTTPRAVDAGSTVSVGSSTLRVRRSVAVGAPVRSPGDGTLLVTPVPGPDPSPGLVEIACPPLPPARSRARVPWVAALATVPVGLVLAVLLGPQLLLLALLGPVSVLASAVADRWGSGRAARRELAAHAAAVQGARSRLAVAVRSETERLERAHPDPASVLAVAERHLAGLWRGGGRLEVRLGTGSVPVRVTWVDGSEREHAVAERAPVVLDLSEVEAVAVLGPPATTDRFLACLVGQLCARVPPHELAVAVADPPAAWGWVGRLPHAAATGPGASARLVVVPAAGPGTAGAGSVGSGARAHTLVLRAVADPSDLPEAGGAVVDLRGEQALLDAPSGRLSFVPDLVGPWWSDRLSRALAPLRCAEPAAVEGLPSRVSLTPVPGEGELTVEAVLRRWAESTVPAGGRSARKETPAPRAVVGRTAAGPFVVDLGSDGPHVLVGGTTGSGKSEFLRTLVLSLALTAPPARLTFVLVDFKGGAAFAPCAGLPHVVGLVTDLDDHLVRRALASLRAELRRREQLFAAVGAGDLAGYERLRAPGSEAVPRLVVVVDELRALVDELPGFVSGLVRLAALGRSLGVHLVLATQRPSGAVSAEIQANVSLRIAFRVRDRADSVDVIDDPAAAAIPASIPGRGFARGGDGRLVEFQAATAAAAERPQGYDGPLRVRSASAPSPVVGRGDTAAGEGAEEAATAEGSAGAAGAGPEAGASATSDHGSAPLAAIMAEAHRASGEPTPRPPWLPPLPSVVEPFASVDERAARGAGGSAAVEVGLVDEPDHQRAVALRWRTTDGPWLLAGPPASGRSTALRTLVLGAASRFTPGRLHVHLVDGQGTLADLAALPHRGVHTRADDLRGCAALARHLRQEVDRRLAVASAGGTAPDADPVVLLVVDGWEHLTEVQPSGSEDLTGELLRVLRDGRAVGVVGAVTGGRALLHPRWSGVGGHTFLLGSVDPLDAALAGLRAADLPREPPPGRAVRVRDRREVHFALTTAAHTSRVVAQAGGTPREGSAWRWRPLPNRAGRPDRPGQPPGDLLVGVAADSWAPCCWRPADDGRRLLVAGPPRSGRSSALQTLADSLAAAGRVVALVTDRAALRGERPPHEQHPGERRTETAGASPVVVVVRPDDPDTLAELRRRRPDLAVLVDDLDRLSGSPVEPVLREVGALVDRDDGLLVVATSSVALATRFRGLDVELARYRCVLLLNPTPADRDLAGLPVPDGIPRVPGRGVFVRQGELTELQVVLPQQSLVRVPSRQHLDVGVPGHPRGDERHQGHPDDGPADEGTGVLNQAEPDGQQDGVPDDGGRARPRSRAEPAAREQAQPDGAHEDEHRRHDHPGGVAALPEGELDDVEHREPGQGEGL